MSWELWYSVELVCPNHGVIAKYGVYMDDWNRIEERWDFGEGNVEMKCVARCNRPYKQHIVYICKKCGAICKEVKR